MPIVVRFAWKDLWPLLVNTDAETNCSILTLHLPVPWGVAVELSPGCVHAPLDIPQNTREVWEVVLLLEVVHYCNHITIVCGAVKSHITITLNFHAHACPTITKDKNVMQFSLFSPQHVPVTCSLGSCPLTAVGFCRNPCMTMHLQVTWQSNVTNDFLQGRIKYSNTFTKQQIMCNPLLF